MVRDLSQVSNVERLEASIKKGYKPESLTVKMVNDAGEMEMVQVLMPKEGSSNEYCVGLLLEAKERIGVFGKMSEAFLEEVTMHLVEKSLQKRVAKMEKGGKDHDKE